MPTGFTAPILERDNYTFREYLWSCMRNMGVAYAIREDNSTAPITMADIERMKAAEHSEYHVTRLAESEAELETALARSASWWVEDAARKNAEAAAEHARRMAADKVKREKLSAMLVAVDEWHPPTPEHDGFKTFMREQLTATMYYDCGEVEAPTTRDADTHRTKTLEYLTRSITYHREALERDRANAASRAAWVDAVVAITPPPA